MARVLKPRYHPDPESLGKTYRDCMSSRRGSHHSNQHAEDVRRQQEEEAAAALQATIMAKRRRAYTECNETPATDTVHHMADDSFIVLEDSDFLDPAQVASKVETMKQAKTTQTPHDRPMTDAEVIVAEELLRVHQEKEAVINRAAAEEFSVLGSMIALLRNQFPYVAPAPTEAKAA